MSTLHPPKTWTAEEFERLDDDLRYELTRGELRPMPPPPGAEHGSLTIDLTLEVGLFVREHRLGRCFAAETRFTIERNPDTVVAPDMAYVARERLPAKMPAGFLDLAPDLVLEVRSPSDRKREVKEKVERWLAAGVRMVWELHPARRILTVYRPGAEAREPGIDDTLSGEDVLPGFALPLRRLLSEADEI